MPCLLQKVQVIESIKMFIEDMGTAVGGNYFGNVDDGNKREVISHCLENTPPSTIFNP